MQSNNINVLILPSTKSFKEISNNFSSQVNIIRGKFTNIEYIFNKSNLTIKASNIALNQFSYIWLSSLWSNRDLAYAVKVYCNNKNIPCSEVESSTSKITDQTHFSLNNLPIPYTYFVSSKKLSKYIDSIEETCGYPLIIKDIKGSRGIFTEFVNNRSDLIDKLVKLPSDKQYMFQEFIPNKYEWGIIVANGKVVSAEKSYPKSDEFRNNACNGAEEVFVELEDIPEEIKNIAEKSAKSLNLDWCRADILIHQVTGKPYLLEVNRFPGITLNTSEVDAAANFLKNKLKNILI